MIFEITLYAKSTDPGGPQQSFAEQLAALGGTATLLLQEPPYRVDVGETYYFEFKRVYRIDYGDPSNEVSDE